MIEFPLLSKKKYWPARQYTCRLCRIWDPSAPRVTAAAGRVLLRAHGCCWHSRPLLRNLLDFILCSFHPEPGLLEPRKVITQHLLDSAVSLACQNTITYIATVKFCPSPFSLYSDCILELGPNSKLSVRQGSVSQQRALSSSVLKN